MDYPWEFSIVVQVSLYSSARLQKCWEIVKIAQNIIYAWISAASKFTSSLRGKHVMRLGRPSHGSTVNCPTLCLHETGLINEYQGQF